MAGKAIVPFNEALSTFALEGEPSPANLALAAMEVDQEAKHITKTPLAIIPAPASEEMPRSAKGGPAEPLVRPNHHGGPSSCRSSARTVRKISTKRGRCTGLGGSARPTTGMLASKDVSKHLFANPLLPMPLGEDQEHVYSLYTKSGNVVSHNYVTTPTRTTTTPSPPQCFHVVGIRTPGGGYDKGLMPGISPKDKGEAESVASSPKGAKCFKRHIPPPPIMRASGQYERDDEQVLKGPKVAQLLRIVIKLRDVHKELSDHVAELTLELKSIKDDYDMLHRDLGVKIECLEKRVEKGNH